MARVTGKVIARALPALAATLFLGAVQPPTSTAATLIAGQADGSVLVRPEAGDAVVIPSPCALALQRRLPGSSDPVVIQAIVAELVAEYAADDGLLAGAIAAYAKTLVPEALGWAVIAGAQEGNPDAAEDISVAAGSAPGMRAGGGLTNLISVGGLGGGGTQEVRRSASEID